MTTKMTVGAPHGMRLGHCAKITVAGTIALLWAAVALAREAAAAAAVPTYAGVHYRARVPDTLDLAERCGLAVHALTQSVDPDKDYTQYFYVIVGEQPIHMTHGISDGCTAKFVESLPMQRVASGNLMAPSCERSWIQRLLQDEGVGAMSGRLLGAAGLYYKLTGDEPYKDAGIRKVKLIDSHVKNEGDTAYYPMPNWKPGSDPNEKPKADFDSMIWVIDGLMRFYRCSGYAPALDLAGRMTRAMMRPDCFYYHTDGSFCDAVLMWPGVKHKQHFHINTLERLAVLEYAAQVGDKPTLDWVAKGLAYAKAHCENTTGWCSEALRDDVNFHAMSETCAVADMVELAIRLSQAGQGDYWDDADRWVRNALAEAQLLDASWGDRFVKSPEGRAWAASDAAKREPTESAEDALRKKFPDGFCTQEPLERNVGAFGGWVAMNDWFGAFGYSDGPVIMHCCTGNGTRALYCAFNAILGHDEAKGAIKLNLLLNRASKWADVNSYLPCQGRVDVQIKQPVSLSVRIPAWVDLSRVNVTLNGQPRTTSFDGRYALVGHVAKGDIAIVRFPISESVIPYRVQMAPENMFPTQENYVLTLKGNTVVKIDPPGRFCPLYERDKYRKAKPKFKTVDRFVCETELGW